MAKITIEELSVSLKDHLKGLGLTEAQVQELIDKFEDEKIGDISQLSTNSKTITGAINELFQSANNGKELIANAIGEPVSAEDTFSAMSTDINSLLSTFKTNMMNNGVTVESNDKFKSLIDKIATMVEEGSGGIQMTNGTFYFNHPIENSYGDLETTTVETGLDFTPTLIIVNCKLTTDSFPYTVLNKGYISNLETFTYKTNYDSRPSLQIYIDNITKESFNLNVSTTVYTGVYCSNWYAIGVGENAALRDSLASILEDEGVSVTEEDDMASLISKVDEEFTKDNEAKDRLYDLMLEGGYDVNNGMSIDDLLGLLSVGGIKLDEIKQMACGQSHTFILMNDGSVWSCGYNGNGQLGLGDTTYRSIFTQVTTNVNNDVKQIACGYYYTFILKNDGSIWSCGYNGSGQLGLGISDYTAHTTFTQVTTNINNDVKQIACGREHVFILKNDGSVWSCGYNDYGQLGLNDATDRTTFTQVTTNISDVKEIACGYYHTFILKNDGSVWACGRNNNKQLGLNDATDRYTFTQVTTNISNDVKQIACGEYHTVILKNNGSVWGCGYNNNGHLGLGDYTVRYTFTQVTTNINNDVEQVACGQNHTFILKNDGSVWACGYNNKGQLGLGDSTDRTTFTQVTTNINNDVTQIDCGTHTFILKTDGSVWSCGYNNEGQLGLGNTTDYKSFTSIPKGFTY